ncbi:MAG TPA: PLP-dependent aspartate aminotransferase family protein [Thermoplasmata archaeon]|nr:PLP-dependent aspartate aminotransferase family protein [Thermoplasmata archaeon]
MSAELNWGESTRCVHGVPAELVRTGPLVPPIVQSTTYAWADLNEPPAISYTRAGNETVAALEARLTALERGAAAVCFGSGIAGIDALLRSIPSGGRVVAGRHLYGGTTRLLERFHADRLQIDSVDSTDVGAVAAALETPANLVLAETPSNPTLEITDIRRTARLAHDAGAILAVDNTLLTPLYQRPLEQGADVAIHSTTKYIDGHDATLGGAVVLPARHAAGTDSTVRSLEGRLRWIRKATGAVLAPMEAWLTLQGCKTLHLRTTVQWEAARRIADTARSHPAVARTLHPGLAGHPGHSVHRGQACGDGGLVGVDLGSQAAARAFVARLRLFQIAENLGPTESIATHPASMTHADLPRQRRLEHGITDGLVRLSVGVETPDDLVYDLKAALDQLEISLAVVA